jgi:hypothetical protein
MQQKFIMLLTEVIENKNKEDTLYGWGQKRQLRNHFTYLRSRNPKKSNPRPVSRNQSTSIQSSVDGMKPSSEPKREESIAQSTTKKRKSTIKTAKKTNNLNSKAASKEGLESTNI